ncbi:hypothetical protein CN941_22140 [Bacillus cereus]|uniref:Lipoprotein n=2 Tax=Bacillus cereus group TaxID=86661 RepID=A0A2A9W434_BACCE|nr:MULTISPECIES: hypothetical protein [Bacillus cereus group]EEL89622.1 hypothetical protein bcere0029_4910 [Bacillus cereus AH1272]EEL95429.1 hypothetical protein bcere0030_4910 [Bacillus cereus AH1273]EJQ07581.1 hypothetical protein IE3_04792 [Bacillus cereus BAG3X2-1]EJS50497.1 hypothetical protein ICG_04880 [Bacillus cereus BAG1X1-3]EOO80611.1 hypothetical protein IC7_05077 [Bacillus cereus BAG1O-1]EOP59533.1 hypothetical protein IKQ_00085 [Bacillus cereus VDM053]OSX97179.1 hypothetical 
MNKKVEHLQKEKQDRNAVVMCVAVSMLIMISCVNKFFGIL